MFGMIFSLRRNGTKVVGEYRCARSPVVGLYVSILFNDNEKHVPPWRRGQPKGQGMDPPRRGGICEAADSGGMFILHPASNGYGNPSCAFGARRLA